MHAAQVLEWGQAPKYVEVTTPHPPPADSDLIQLKLIVSGLHRVAISRASGKHFSANTLPHTPGIDGIGEIVSLPTNNPSNFSLGQKVFFFTWASTGGAYKEILTFPYEDVTPIPEGADPIQIAGLLNPAMSSWMALRKRTTNLPPNFTVLIMGATSASGTIAIDLCRHLGAGKIIGLARNIKKLDELALDQRIELEEVVEETDFKGLGQVDVILDYVYGKPTAHLLATMEVSARRGTQYVQIGSLAGLEMELPSAILRSKNLTIRGSAPGAWSIGYLKGELPGLVTAMGSLKRMDVKAVRLSEIENIWARLGTSTERIVVVP